jgi:2,6-dihydroxypseudooxynicotine hydrolase
VPTRFQAVSLIARAPTCPVECLTLALPHLDPPGERVLIPCEGKHLAEVLRRPKGIARPPIVSECEPGIEFRRAGLSVCPESYA